MDHPAQHTEHEIEPVVQQLIVPSHNSIEQRDLGRPPIVQYSFIQYETEYKDQLVHHLQSLKSAENICWNQNKVLMVSNDLFDIEFKMQKTEKGTKILSKTCISAMFL